MTAIAPVLQDSGARARSSVASRLRRWGLLLGLFAFATAWNLTKAYHIDDTIYVEMAQWIAGHPLHPMRGRVFWGDEIAPIDGVNQPHLYFYAMAAWGSLFGWNEVSMHSLLALFALAAIVLMHRLAEIIVPEKASLATCLVVASPAFVVDQNTMVDVPALALWLGFFAILLARRDEAGSDRLRYVGAGLVCGAAILTKYTSLVLLPALVLDGVLRRRPVAWHGVAVAIAIVLLWSGFNYWDYGGIHMLTRTDARGFWNVLDPRKWILCLGAAAPFAFALAGAWLQRSGLRLRWLATLGLCAGVAAFLAIIGGALHGLVTTQTSDTAFAAFFIASGSIALALAILGLPRRDVPMRRPVIARWILAYWAAGAAAFIVLLAPFIAMRHVLLALPAVVLLALAAIPRRPPTGWTVAAVLTAFLSTSVVASADRWYAGLYRDEAKRLRDALPASARVWTTGHWGWQWYAEKNGMMELVPGESHPAVDDFIVYPERVHRQPLPANIVDATVETVPIAPSNGVRTFASPNAGFYATSAFEQLPWAVRRDPIEIFHVLRVETVRHP
jgi:4-amino-4-deoxy-L-arabinose transferase-like glycosyltransferase